MVLINDTVKKYVLKLPLEARKRIREKFEFLESGLWDGGLKVKKIKGVSAKYLFEARLDRGNRILFTLGRHHEPVTDDSLLVYVWGIVEHDDVSKKIKTIIPANAPFLQFHQSHEVLMENIDMEELEPGYYTQESITQRTNDEAGSQKWYEVDPQEWERLQMYQRDEEDFELFLHLTPQQKDVMQTPLPLIISGTAGSGKTSLAVYYLLNPNLNKKKKLFITYNDHLKNFARKLYNGLLNQREWQAEALAPDFYTFKELCREIYRGHRFHPENEVDFNRFHRMYTTNPMYQTYDAALVWEEIRAVIKGAARGDDRFLTFEEYEALGKKKAPNFRFNRKDIYRIFQWYQDKLESENLWDEVDMTPRTVYKKYVYDILACDEIQDFTDTQLALLFQFVKNPKNMFLAGDTRQTVNPSAFRWEEVRQHFYREKTKNPDLKLEVPDLKLLNINFRSSGSIVELANMLLELREDFFGRHSGEAREEWKYKGRPVTVVSGIDADEMLRLLQKSGPNRTILVRTEEEKENLKKRLDTGLVFTIKEAKGLEFDTVVLWKFCHDQWAESEDVWKAMLDMSAREIHEAKIKYEINLLYVGVTRAVQNLVIYDGPVSSFIWASQPLKQYVYITADRDYIEGIWNAVTTPEEWVRQGNYFFDRKFFKAAVECYKNSGSTGLLDKARAYYYQQTGDYLEAAEHFEIIGETEAAAVNYEQAGDYEKALALWKELDNPQRESRCRAALLSKQGKHREAGQLYLRTGQYQAAVDSFKKAKNYAKVAEIYLEHLHDPGRAAHYYESSRNFPRAAALYERLEMFDKAAGLYFTLKNYPKAQVLWEKTGNVKQLLRLYKKTGQRENLLLMYEKEGSREKAVKYLKTSNLAREQLIEEAGESLEKGNNFQALIRYQAADEPQGTARCFQRMGNYPEAIEYFEEAGDLRSAADLCFHTGDFEGALTGYLQDSEDRKENYKMARQALDKIQNIPFVTSTAVDCYVEENYDGVSLLLPRLEGFEPLEGICYALAGSDKKALKNWKRCRYFGQCVIIAENCLENKLAEVGGQYLFNIAKGNTAMQKYEFSLPLEDTPVWKLWEEFLKTKKEIKDRRPFQMVWGNFIHDEDRDFKNPKLVLESIAVYNDYDKLADYFRRFLFHEPLKYFAMIESFRHILATHASIYDYKNFAFKSLLLGDLKELKWAQDKMAASDWDSHKPIKTDTVIYLEGDELKAFYDTLRPPEDFKFPKNIDTPENIYTGK